MDSTSYCTMLDHPRRLSDHSPVAFGIKKRTKTPGRYLPAWIATHASFETGVERAMEQVRLRFIEESHNVDSTPVEDLAILKMSIRKAAKHIRTSDAQKIASTTKHKLAITLAFIRSIDMGDLAHATKLQKKYDGLSCDGVCDDQGIEEIFENQELCRRINEY